MTYLEYLAYYAAITGGLFAGALIFFGVFVNEDLRRTFWAVGIGLLIGVPSWAYLDYLNGAS